MAGELEKRACSLLSAESRDDHGRSLLEMDPEAAEAMRAVLVNPGLRACDARAELIELANDARVAELAVEAAHSGGACNSVERMLLHQMALGYKSCFGLERQLQAALSKASADDAANLRAYPPCYGNVARDGGYQQGAMTLQRLRSGGQQTVVVQHVQVSEGGQAIVAGEIKAGGRRKRAEGGPEV